MPIWSAATVPMRMAAPPAAAPHVAAANDHRQLHAGALNVDEHAGGLFKLLVAEQLAVQPRASPLSLRITRL